MVTRLNLQTPHNNGLISTLDGNIKGKHLNRQDIGLIQHRGERTSSRALGFWEAQIQLKGTIESRIDERNQFSRSFMHLLEVYSHLACITPVF